MPTRKRVRVLNRIDSDSEDEKENKKRRIVDDEDDYWKLNIISYIYLKVNSWIYLLL